MTQKITPIKPPEIDSQEHAEPEDEVRELVKITDTQLVDLFESGEGFLEIRKQLDELIDTTPVCLTTAAGRKHVKSFAYKFAQLRSRCDKVGAAHVKAEKEKLKAFDGNRALLRNLLQERQDRIRQPVDEWEAEEEARRGRHVMAVERIRELSEARDTNGNLRSVIALHDCRAMLLDTVVDSRFEEFEREAAVTKHNALDANAAHIQGREAEERALQAAEEARQAAEKKAREAEEALEQEREEARIREAELKAAAAAREEALREAREAQEAQAREAEDKLVAKLVAEELAQTLRETSERQAEEDERELRGHKAVVDLADARAEKREEVLQGVAVGLFDLMGEAILRDIDGMDGARFVVDAIANNEVDNLRIVFTDGQYLTGD